MSELQKRLKVLEELLRNENGEVETLARSAGSLHRALMKEDGGNLVGEAATKMACAIIIGLLIGDSLKGGEDVGP